MLTISEQELIDKLQIHHMQTDAKNLDKITKNVLEKLKNGHINYIDKLSCGLAFRHNRSDQTNQSLQLVEKYYEGQKINGYEILENNNINFDDLQNIFFINFHDETYSVIVKEKIEFYQAKLFEPVEKKVFDDLLFKDAFQSKLETEITELKLEDKTSKTLTDFDKSDIKQQSAEKRMLNDALSEFVVKNEIERHNRLHNKTSEYIMKLFNQQMESNPGSEINVKLPPTKGYDRSLEKQNEQQIEVDELQPVYKLKDLSRLAFIFNNFEDIQKFQNQNKDNYMQKSAQNLQIIEVKNGFKLNKENKRFQSYKDIKLIQQIKIEDVPIIIESQLLHKEIIKLKETQHKFYNFSRSSFTNKRNVWIYKTYLNGLKDLEINKLNYDRTCYFYYIFEGLQNYLQPLKDQIKGDSVFDKSKSLILTINSNGEMYKMSGYELFIKYKNFIIDKNTLIFTHKDIKITSYRVIYKITNCKKRKN